MQKHAITGYVVAVVVIGAGAFYGGMRYERSTAVRFPGGNAGNGRTLTAEQRQQMFPDRAGRTRGGGPGGGGVVAGTILGHTGEQITVQLRDGGSRIVFLAASTTITTPVTAKPADLTNGTIVFVSGTPNADGSMTAETVQIRPAATR